MVTVGWGPFRAQADPGEAETAFYVQDFALRDPAPWKIPARSARLEPTEWSGLLAGGGEGGARGGSCFWHAPDATPFSAVFQEIMIAIRGGVFEKTVPVVTESGACEGDPRCEVAAAVAGARKPLRAYGWIDGSRGFAGATPEMLFALEQDRLETMALAGTARSEDRDVFAVDEKEIREHEYVAQTLVAKLLDLGRLERRPREILDLGSIVHFLTTIRVSLESPPDAERLIRRLHPTPALGPLPRTDDNLRLLLGWRERLGCPAGFGAPFGCRHGGRFEAVVAIRGVWWDGRDLRLPAGCGIIEASRLVNEWRELRLKREAVKRFLGPA